MRYLVCFAFFAAVSLPADLSLAQDLDVYGKVVRNGSQFHLDCTNVQLQSSTVRLEDWKGDDVGLSGPNVGSRGAPVIEVAEIHTAQDLLELDGTAKLGEEIELKLESANGTFYLFLFALDTGFLPLGSAYPGLKGTILVDLSSTAVLASGPFSGSVELGLLIPNNPNLVGLKFWIQAAILTSTSANYLNVVCAEIEE